MMHLKPVPVFEPHVVRNQCKLIWDSSAHARHKPAKKKVGFADESVERTENKQSNSDRNSLVASRISFYEDKGEVICTGDQDLEAKIVFDDHATTTFEYEDEESALEKYLVDHPEEREEAMRQEDEINGVTVQPTEELLHDSPRAPPTEPEVSMKSNTIIGSAGGALTSYKSKMQTQEFQFGMTPEPEPEPTYYARDADNDTEDTFNLLPAEDTENDAFSAESGKADMLF